MLDHNEQQSETTSTNAKVNTEGGANPNPDASAYEHMDEFSVDGASFSSADTASAQDVEGQSSRSEAFKHAEEAMAVLQDIISKHAHTIEGLVSGALA